MDRRSFGVIGSQGRHYLRLSTATDMESLKEGLRRIEAASQDKKGFEDFVRRREHLY
jgi:aspartate/methionine/tyrosine aminotransferase